MPKLRALPDGIKLMGSIMSFNSYEKKIRAAKNTGDPQKERDAIATATKEWSEEVARKFKLEVEVEGQENIPEKDGFVVIANHQGYGDILVLFMALDGKQIGFIAKDTLEKVPYFGKWIQNIRGLFIKRGNAKEALKSISDGAKLVKDGYNLVIFPEGTRSKGPNMAEFKPGSFKLATKAKAPILPVTINGTYHLYEEKGYAQPTKVKVVIHPAVETASLSRKELTGVEGEIYNTIASGLTE